MELHRLPVDVGNLQRQGDLRALQNRRIRSVQEILRETLASMEEEDRLQAAYTAWVTGRPVPQLKHPRRTLRQWLAGRKPLPPPVPAVMSSAEPWVRG